MAFDIDAALRYVVEREGSDLHVKVASPPMARIHGALRPIEGSEPLTRARRPRRRSSTSSPTQRCSRSSPTRARRTSPTRSAGCRGSASTPSASAASVSIACRAIPFQVRTIDDLGPARGDPHARRAAARDRPADRHDRLGQVDDAGGDDRPHQLEPLAAHRHPRGPDRVPAPRQALDHQPARGRPGHRELRPRDAQGAAPGPGRDPDRRDARRGDGPHRARGRRDRPPRALHAPHPGRVGDDQPDHRLLPAPPPAAGAGDARVDAAGRGLAAARPADRRQRAGRGLRGDGRSPAGSRT